MEVGPTRARGPVAGLKVTNVAAGAEHNLAVAGPGGDVYAWCAPQPPAVRPVHTHAAACAPRRVASAPVRLAVPDLRDASFRVPTAGSFTPVRVRGSPVLEGRVMLPAPVAAAAPPSTGGFAGQQAGRRLVQARRGSLGPEEVKVGGAGGPSRAGGWGCGRRTGC